MLQPPSPDSFVWYSLICLRRGGSTAAVTLYTVADESKKKMTDCVTRSPARLCSGYRKICYYGHLGTIFSLLFHASYFSYFLLPHPGMFIFFVFLSLCSSHLLLSASAYFTVRVLPSCVICILPHLEIILFLLVLCFFVVLYLGWSVLLRSRTRYAST